MESSAYVFYQQSPYVDYSSSFLQENTDHLLLWFFKSLNPTLLIKEAVSDSIYRINKCFKI